jgi:hypothetical protein
MKSMAVRSSLLALWIATGAAAHHPPFMERCHSFTFTGEIARIEWRNPHVELSVRTEGGETHQVTWLDLQGLSRAGIDRDTLRPGDRVTVTAGTRDEVTKRPMLLAAITRARDGWEWSQVPQGC